MGNSDSIVSVLSKLKLPCRGVLTLKDGTTCRGELEGIDGNFVKFKTESQAAHGPRLKPMPYYQSKNLDIPLNDISKFRADKPS